MAGSLSRDGTGPGLHSGQDNPCSLTHPTRLQSPTLLSLESLPHPAPGNPSELGDGLQSHTRVDGLVAGEVALVAEGGLAAVTLVGFVTVRLQRVPLEGSLLRKAAVTLIAEEGPILCWRMRGTPGSAPQEREVGLHGLSPLEPLPGPN